MWGYKSNQYGENACVRVSNTNAGTKQRCELRRRRSGSRPWLWRDQRVTALGTRCAPRDPLADTVRVHGVCAGLDQDSLVVCTELGETCAAALDGRAHERELQLDATIGRHTAALNLDGALWQVQLRDCNGRFGVAKKIV